MQPWTRYQLHLLLAISTTAGAGFGLSDGPGPARAAFWFACLAAALYNAVLFGVGWQQTREAADAT